MLIRERQTGFTIVELLIVIVVIGVLAAIVIVAYNGVTAEANNKAKISELKAFEKLYEMYKVQNGTYPQQSVTSGRYCLGTGFPGAGTPAVPSCYLTGYGGTYNQYSYPENDATAVSIRNDLATVGKVPSPIVRYSVNNVMGPVVTYSATYIELITVIKASSINNCPSGTALSWPPDQTTLEQQNGRLECRIRLMK